jgi:hypothetical protein
MITQYILCACGVIRTYIPWVAYRRVRVRGNTLPQRQGNTYPVTAEIPETYGSVLGLVPLVLTWEAWEAWNGGCCGC